MLAKTLKAALLLYACYFLLGSFAAPLFVHNHQAEMADYVYGVFSSSCQQQPSRTFWLLGYPMALCARCTGIYTGFVLMGLRWLKGGLHPTKLLFGVLLAIGLGEKLMEWFLWEANNWVRFGSGLAFGAALLLGLVSIVQFGWRLSGKYEFKKIALFRHQ